MDQSANGKSHGHHGGDMVEKGVVSGLGVRVYGLGLAISSIITSSRRGSSNSRAPRN